MPRGRAVLRLQHLIGLSRLIGLSLPVDRRLRDDLINLNFLIRGKMAFDDLKPLT